MPLGLEQIHIVATLISIFVAGLLAFVGLKINNSTGKVQLTVNQALAETKLDIANSLAETKIDISGSLNKILVGQSDLNGTLSAHTQLDDLKHSDFERRITKLER